jgi:hypothetical protein
VRDISDPTYVAELVEFAESLQIELDAIHHELFDRLGQMETLRRKLVNIGENLAELLDARAVPAVFEFEEVDR